MNPTSKLEPRVVCESPRVLQIEQPLANLHEVTALIDSLRASERGRFDALCGSVFFDSSLMDNLIFVPHAALRPHIHQQDVLLHGLGKPRREETLIFNVAGESYRHSWNVPQIVDDKVTVPWLYIPRGLSHRGEAPEGSGHSMIGSLLRNETGTWDFISE